MTIIIMLGVVALVLLPKERQSPDSLIVYKDIDLLFVHLLREYGDTPLPAISTRDADFVRFAQEELGMEPELAEAMASRRWEYAVSQDSAGKVLSEIPEDGHVIEAVRMGRVIGFVTSRGVIRVSAGEVVVDMAE